MLAVRGRVVPPGPDPGPAGWQRWKAELGAGRLLGGEGFIAAGPREDTAAARRRPAPRFPGSPARDRGPDPLCRTAVGARSPRSARRQPTHPPRAGCSGGTGRHPPRRGLRSPATGR